MGFVDDLFHIVDRDLSSDSKKKSNLQLKVPLITWNGFLWGSEGSSSVDFFKSCSVSALTLSFCITVIQFLLCYLILTFPLRSPSLQHIHDFFFFFVVFVWRVLDWLQKTPGMKFHYDTPHDTSIKWMETRHRVVSCCPPMAVLHEISFFSRLITYKTEQHSQSSMANIILVL